MMAYTRLVDEEFLWGALYNPVVSNSGSEEAMRLVIFGSTNAGVLVIKSLLEYQSRFPKQISIVGVATDDPADPQTKISVKKRIWKYYNQEDMVVLRDKVIEAAIGGGLPCYTGSVKTDKFREIFRKWNPDALIMCCFGQKIDPFLFNFPRFGMYNFHPSDLASKIGEGSQPFHDTINNGKTTSVMTIHLVNEWIDRGPIVGFSSKINILKDDGNYPVNILSLQEKIPSVCGWLSIELVLEILKQRGKGISGPVTEINFDELTPVYIRQKLLEPANDDLSDNYTLPLHDLIQ